MLAHVLLQALAQRTRGLALAADPHRQMAAARKYPDVAFQARQKLDVDLHLLARHVISQRRHRVFRRELGSHFAQRGARARRSEEHTSELQSQFHLVCRLLLEKKNNTDLREVTLKNNTITNKLA